jgi:hypothetical protein
LQAVRRSYQLTKLSPVLFDTSVLKGDTCRQLMQAAADQLCIKFQLFWQLDRQPVEFSPSAPPEHPTGMICRLAYSGKEFRAVKPALEPEGESEELEAAK